MNEISPEFRRCLVISFALHAGFFLVLKIWPLRSWTPIEIDLTNNLFLGDGPAKLGAPKRMAPNAPAAVPLPAETNKPPEPVPVPAPPKDWTLPGPSTNVLEKPAPPPPTPGGSATGSGTSPLTGGSGEGADYGTPNGTGHGGAPLLSLPRLLNRDEVLRNLRKFYPEFERRAGREGVVIVAIHISAAGAVSGVDVMQTASPAFDGAAQKVARIMRFSPAMAKSGPVAVKISQPMVFKLED